LFRHGEQEIRRSVTADARPVSACREQVTAGGISTRIPKAELTGIYGTMVKRMSRKMLGAVPEPVEVAWHNRKVLNFSFTPSLMSPLALGKGIEFGRHARRFDRADPLEDLQCLSQVGERIGRTASGQCTAAQACQRMGLVPITADLLG